VPRGVWSIWNELPPASREPLREVFRELRAEHHGLPGRLARRYAKLLAEIWVTTDAISEEAAKLAVARKHGKGRKPTAPKLRLQAKRQAMQANAVDTALAKLTALVKKDHAKKLAVVPRRMA
jgi:hypothetical protein